MLGCLTAHHICYEPSFQSVSFLYVVRTFCMRSGVFLQEARLTIVSRILRASFKNLQVTRDREVRKRIFKEEKSIKNRYAEPQCDVNLVSSTWKISSRAINRRRYIFLWRLCWWKSSPSFLRLSMTLSSVPGATRNCIAVLQIDNEITFRFVKGEVTFNWTW